MDDHSVSHHLGRYAAFLNAKRHTTGNYGFDPVWLPQGAFDFQNHILEKAVRKGRIGVFADTGLGKTLIQIAIAENIIRKTNGRVLILTPLAVAFQFIDEANRINVFDIAHSKDGKLTKKITVCNYERLHLLNPDDFECVMLDESSILKNFNGKIRDQIVAFIKRVKYRFLSTATPSPNDFIELGNSSEALGYLGYMDMLTKFFKSNQGSVDSNNRNIGEKFYLKPHAERDFFAWVNQWSVMVKKPSDLGFSDDGYDLPKLHINKHTVKNDKTWVLDGQSALFAQPAQTMTEVRAEQKLTVIERCEQAFKLASGKTSVYWCNLNDESALLKSMDRDAIEIIGGMSIDQKEEILVSFAKGDIQRLITKAKMTSAGLNWQHCNHTVFFPTWSYEQYYQSIRRFWRFGQKREVTCDMVVSEGQERVIKALDQKMQKAIDLYASLVDAANLDFTIKTKDFSQLIQLPEFLA
jgi:ERCC4-related helicase